MSDSEHLNRNKEIKIILAVTIDRVSFDTFVVFIGFYFFTRSYNVVFEYPFIHEVVDNASVEIFQTNFKIFLFALL